MKHVVITGSTRGIGKGLAEQFLIRGWYVTLNGTKAESLALVLPLLKGAYPGRVQGVAGRTEEIGDMKNLYQQAVAGFGPVDIWINNAGIDQERELFIACDLDKIRNLIAVNIMGVMNGTQVALKEMLAQGYGAIYNMEGFGSDDRMMKKMSVYGTSKRAITYFTQSLAKECKGTPVKIGRLAPGIVVTDLMLRGLPKDKKEAEKTKKVYNQLADTVEDVTQFLVERMIKNTKNDKHINWLTPSKIIGRILTARGKRKNFFAPYSSQNRMFL